MRVCVYGVVKIGGGKKMYIFSLLSVPILFQFLEGVFMKSFLREEKRVTGGLCRS